MRQKHPAPNIFQNPFFLPGSPFFQKKFDSTPAFTILTFVTYLRNMRFVALPFVILLLILAFGVVSGVSGESAGNSPKRILMLSSYHPAFPTYQQQVDGVRDTFADRDVLIDIEFMDSKRFMGEKTRLQFLDMLGT